MYTPFAAIEHDRQLWNIPRAALPVETSDGQTFRMEEKGLACKKDVGGSLYRGLWVLTDEGKTAAEQVSLRASRAVELAGKDLTDETRDIFYKALESITVNLTDLTKEGIPE